MEMKWLLTSAFTQNVRLLKPYRSNQQLRKHQQQNKGDEERGVPKRVSSSSSLTQILQV
ncbi:unnamed protein product [Brassica napus]|uniref:(rape) hypothetical protein n=1 Tax=Brassica napus TaxID=3708 RepID=A0A816KCV1_BRANA|nr:unnamed protein product [Brassica napus]